MHCSGARKTGPASPSSPASSAVTASEVQPSPAKKPRGRPPKAAAAAATTAAAADAAMPTSAPATAAATTAATAAAARQKARKGVPLGADGKAKKTKTKATNAKVATAEELDFSGPQLDAQSPVSDLAGLRDSSNNRQRADSTAQTQLLSSSRLLQSVVDDAQNSLDPQLSPEAALAGLPLRDRLHKIQALLLDAGISPSHALLAPCTAPLAHTARADDNSAAQDHVMHRQNNAAGADIDTEEIASLPCDTHVSSSPGRTTVEDTICLISPSPAPIGIQHQQQQQHFVSSPPLQFDFQKVPDNPTSAQLAFSPRTDFQSSTSFAFCTSPVAAADAPVCEQQHQQHSQQQQLPQQGVDAADSLTSSVMEASLPCSPSTQNQASAALQKAQPAESSGHFGDAEGVVEKPELMAYSDSNADHNADHQQLLLSPETRQSKKRTR